MSELDRLRGLGDQVVPPSFEVLRETARRRYPPQRCRGVARRRGSRRRGRVDRPPGRHEDRSAPEPVGPPYEVSTTHPLTYALGRDGPLRRRRRSTRPPRSSSWT